MSRCRTSAHVVFIQFICLLASDSLRADLTLDAHCLAQPPNGVHVGDDVEMVRENDTTAIRFASDGIKFPLSDNLSADSGTVSVRFRVPKDWPVADRTTLLHIGEQSHVHVTLFANQGRLIAVYKAGPESYSAINHREAADWVGGSWHEAVFAWRAQEELVEFFLELDGRLVGRQTGQLIATWPQRGYLGARRRGQAWLGSIAHAKLSDKFTLPAELRPGKRSVHINGNLAKGTIYNFWSVNNFTSQHLFADPKYGERVRQEKPFMKQVNCVRLLGGRHDGRNQWFRGVDEQGNASCDFSGLIRYLDGIVNAGYTPRIVLDNIPTAMSDPGKLATYGNTRPAKDLQVWHQYVQEVVQAMVDKFGEDQVAKWRFRVGTEPDLNPGHWQGTKEDYLRHYDCTVDAVCSVIPDAVIGPGNILNPAKTTQLGAAGHQAWGLDIVDHCAVGTNTWSGGKGTRMCFLECSWYGQVGQPIDSLDVAIARMRDRLNRYAQLENVPVSIAEFAILRDEHGRRLYGGDITEWGASWYAAVADRIFELEVPQVHEWSQASARILHPRTLVIGFLELMQGGQRLEATVTGGSAARAGALGCFKNGSYYVLLYNHRAWRSPSIEEQIDITLASDALGRRNWKVSEWVVDRDHGVFVHQLYRDCEQIEWDPLPESPIYGGQLVLRFGQPIHRLMAQNHAKYARLAVPGQLRKDEPITLINNELRITIDMPGHSVRLLVFTPSDTR